MIAIDQPDHWDSVVKLTEIYLAVAKGDPQYMKEVEEFTTQLLKRDPNSFDGHRLVGDLNYSKATDAFKNRRPEEGQSFLDAAATEYRKADSVKPSQLGGSMQLARVLAAKGDFTGSETIYRRVIGTDKTYQYSYNELYRILLIQNKPGDAEQVLKTAFVNNPKQVGFLALLAMHYYRLGRRDEMVNVLNQIKSHANDFEQI